MVYTLSNEIDQEGDVKFEQSSYYVNVSERTTTGNEILQVKATTDNPFDKVTYRLTGSDAFYIEQNTGNVYKPNTNILRKR